MRKLIPAALAGNMALMVVGATAQAHAFLDYASPPVGSTVPTPPQQIRLTFTQGIEPAFSRVELATAQGQPIQTGPATVDPSDNMQLVLTVPRLDPGRYRVTWRVVSVDTHPTEGAFEFEVKP
jgi:copper resistance protein C